MIEIRELKDNEISDFWQGHIKYLIEDGLIKEQSEIDYYSGLNYHNKFEGYLKEATDKLHMVWFIKDGVKIGATQYKINKSGDGECYIYDFWCSHLTAVIIRDTNALPPLKITQKIDGAFYYKLDAEKENSIRFGSHLALKNAE